MRNITIASVICCSLVGLAAADDAHAAIKKTTNIPAQALEPALQRLAKERDLQLVYRSDLVGELHTSGAVGDLTAQEALQQLLIGTGLALAYLDDKTVTLVQSNVRSDVAQAAPASGTAVPAATHGAPVDASPGGGSFWSRFRVAQVDPRPASGATGVASSSDDAQGASSFGLEEVIVTARKRTERLQDVPQAVTVLSGVELAKSGSMQFRDYASRIPGLGFNTTGAGHTSINLRGLAAAQFEIGSRVAQYLDEVPYGASNPFTFGGRFTLDPALSDVERIEVLRGPQGTLYGASSMGGLIKYVAAPPETDRFGADLRTGVSATQDGGTGYNASVTANAPLSPDRAALRVVGFGTHDAGYVDNLSRDDDDANQADIYGGRVDLLLTPNEQLRVRLTGLVQEIRRDGEATVDYTFAGGRPNGELGQNRGYPESLEQSFNLVSATVEYDLGAAELISISSYQSARSEYTQDYRYLLSLGGGAFSALGSQTYSDGDKIAQEVRLSSDPEAQLEWVVGGFYTREDFTGGQVLLSLDLAGQPLANNLYTYTLPSLYQEYAAFGTLTWHLTGKLDVSAGLRYARNSQEKEVIGTGTIGRGLNDPLRESDDDVLTYLANARYHFTDQVTGYVRYATGYKAGGPNAMVIDAATGEVLSPDTLDAETLASYEIGIKGDTPNRLLRFDLAAFYTDWRDIQVNTSRGSPAVGVYLNAPSARVQGGELSLELRPFDAFTLAGAFAYTDAQLAEPAPDLRGAKGERLPNVPRFTAVLSADYVFAGSALRPMLGLSMRHVSDRTASYNANTANRQYRLPDYEALDLRAGLVLGSVDVQLYVRNLLDERGQLSAYTFQGFPQVAILQPRTYGLSLMTSF